MLKQVVQYKDFDDVNRTETVYFNLTKTELLDHLEIVDRLDSLSKKLENSETLNMVQMSEILDMVKTFMKWGYGVRSEDGKRFIKNDDVWTEFTQTPVYDALLMHLFMEDPTNAMHFLTKMIPQDLMEQVKQDQPELFDGMPSDDEVKLPEPERKLESYTREELLNLPQSEFDRLVGTDPLRMQQNHLQIAFQRKNQTGGQG